MEIEHLKKMSDEKFRRTTGVKKHTFDVMVEILTEAKRKQKARGGRPNKVGIEKSLLIWSRSSREGMTYNSIAAEFYIAESTAYEIVRWVEDALIKSGVFRLPGKKALLDEDNQIETVLIDVTETPIERPQKNQKKYYSGKKKDIQ